MSSITREVVIKAPRQQVWDILSDFGNVYRLAPTITKSYLTSETTSGLDTTRHCDFSMMGASVDERITGWDEGKRLQIGFDNWDNMPGMVSMSAEFTLEDEGEDTRMRTIMNYEMGMGVVGKMMNSMMVKPMNTKNWDNFVAGIRHHIETGEEVSKKTEISTSGIVAIA